MSEDPFVSVHAPPAGQSLFAQVGVTAQRTTYSEFESEDFIQAFLNPAERSCPRRHPPDCLCDVDVSKTEGMTWDKCPPQLLNVETHEDLVRAAANIWLNYDLADGSRVKQKLDWLDDPEKVEKIRGLVSSGRAVHEIEDLCHVSIDSHTYSVLRRALGVRPPQRVDHDLLRRFHAEGLSLKGIRQRFIEVEGLAFHPTTISKVLRRIGLEPNYMHQYRAGSGTPRGYKRSSGLSYNEWRKRHAEG